MTFERKKSRLRQLLVLAAALGCSSASFSGVLGHHGLPAGRRRRRRRSGRHGLTRRNEIQGDIECTTISTSRTCSPPRPAPPGRSRTCCPPGAQLDYSAAVHARDSGPDRARSPFLSADEARILNQIRGHEYLALFGAGRGVHPAVRARPCPAAARRRRPPRPRPAQVRRRGGQAHPPVQAVPRARSPRASARPAR